MELFVLLRSILSFMCSQCRYGAICVDKIVMELYV